MIFRLVFRSAKRESGARKQVVSTFCEDYLIRYSSAAVDELVKHHWPLPEDRAALIQRRGPEWDAATR